MTERGTVVLRADASEEFGFGHVVRSLTLGKALKELGWTVMLATRDLPSDLLDRARAAAIEIEPLGQHSFGNSEGTEIVGLHPDLVIADRYRLEAHFFETLRDAGALLCLVDDNGENDYALADIVLNQNPSASPDSFGPPSHRPQLLLGLDYALVRDEILLEQRRSLAPKDDPAVFLSMGGSDPLHLCEPLAALLSNHSIVTAVTVGQATTGRDALVRRLGMLANITVVPEVEFARSLAAATIAVIGAGTTMWEAAFLGVPSISIVAAANQVRPAAAASTLGFTHCVEGRSPEAVATVGQALEHLLSNKSLQLEMSRKGREAIDGAGAVRVATVLSDLTSQRRRALC